MCLCVCVYACVKERERLIEAIKSYFIMCKFLGSSFGNLRPQMFELVQYFSETANLFALKQALYLAVRLFLGI